MMAGQPILGVRDVAVAREHYHRVLGFEEGWIWGDPPVHGGTSFGSCRVQFSLQAEPSTAITSIRVEGIDALFAMHEANGADIVEPISARPWGAREYALRDLDGHWLRFAEMVWEGAERRESLPELEVEERLPSLVEYEALLDAVGWRGYTPARKGEAILAAALAGFTATVGGEAIGCALVMGDAVANMVVRDVMVRPEFQSQGVGTALMTALTAWVEREAAPATYVTLLCIPTRVPFYEKFGFHTSEGGLTGMSRRIGRR